MMVLVSMVFSLFRFSAFTSPRSIQIIGSVDTEVVTTGKLQISKKDFTKLTNRAAALLELFLHGFMQERKEMEAVQE